MTSNQSRFLVVRAARATALRMAASTPSGEDPARQRVDERLDAAMDALVEAYRPRTA